MLPKGLAWCYFTFTLYLSSTNRCTNFITNLADCLELSEVCRRFTVLITGFNSVECNCDPYGSWGVTCDETGQCPCKPTFQGLTCDKCKPNFYNYPNCEGENSVSFTLHLIFCTSLFRIEIRKVFQL